MERELINFSLKQHMWQGLILFPINNLLLIQSRFEVPFTYISGPVILLVSSLIESL